eukprot:6200994-Pleurochrysis_carterae.AAC.2
MILHLGYSEDRRQRAVTQPAVHDPFSSLMQHNVALSAILPKTEDETVSADEQRTGNDISALLWRISGLANRSEGVRAARPPATAYMGCAWNISVRRPGTGSTIGMPHGKKLGAGAGPHNKA